MKKKHGHQPGSKPPRIKIQERMDNYQNTQLEYLNRRVSLLEEIILRIQPAWLQGVLNDLGPYELALNANLSTNFSLTGMVEISEYNLKAA